MPRIDPGPRTVPAGPLSNLVDGEVRRLQAVDTGAGVRKLHGARALEAVAAQVGHDPRVLRRWRNQSTVRVTTARDALEALGYRLADVYPQAAAELARRDLERMGEGFCGRCCEDVPTVRHGRAELCAWCDSPAGAPTPAALQRRERLAGAVLELGRWRDDA